MALTRPDKDIATYLGGDLAALSLGVNLFYGPVRGADDNYPSKAVFCILDGGPPPLPIWGTDVVRRSRVALRVRGDRMKYDEGLDLAVSVRASVHYAAIVGYLDTRAEQAEPIFIGNDEDGHPEWVINILMQHRRTE